MPFDGPITHRHTHHSGGGSAAVPAPELRGAPDLSLERKKPKAPFEYQSITFSSVVAIQTFFFVLIYYVSKYEEKEKGVSYTVATYLGESEKRPIAGDLFIVRVRRN